MSEKRYLKSCACWSSRLRDHQLAFAAVGSASITVFLDRGTRLIFSINLHEHVILRHLPSETAPAVIENIWNTSVKSFGISIHEGSGVMTNEEIDCHSVFATLGEQGVAGPSGSGTVFPPLASTTSTSTSTSITCPVHEQHPPFRPTHHHQRSLPTIPTQAHRSLPNQTYQNVDLLATTASTTPFRPLTDQEFFAQFTQSLTSNPFPPPPSYPPPLVSLNNAEAGPSDSSSPPRPTDATRELAARARAGRGRRISHPYGNPHQLSISSFRCEGIELERVADGGKAGPIRV